MSSYDLQTPYTIIQNTNVASSTAPVFEYDYNFTFLANSNQSVNALFSTATYMQDSNNPDGYVVNLVLDTEYFSSLISNPFKSKDPLPGQYDGVSTLMTNMSSGGQANLGQFLLEVIALKLFGNAEAVAAILNDSEFTSSEMHMSIVNGITNSLITDANLIFSQYVKNGKINSSENDKMMQYFDFSDSKFTFPLYLSGTIPTLLGPILQNGSPLVTTGSKINNFTYNIPILLTIDGQVQNN